MLSYFSAISFKGGGGDFCDYLLASLENEAFSKRFYSLKGRICS